MFSSIGAIEIQKLVSNEATITESDFSLPSVRLSPKTSEISNWNKQVVAALEISSRVNPFIPDLPLGSVVPSVDAVNWSGQGDVRPRLKDKTTGQSRLIDTGSMISVAMKLPTDKEDKTLSLVAVNGSNIKTYGIRNLTFNIGRKQYQMPA